MTANELDAVPIRASCGSPRLSDVSEPHRSLRLHNTQALPILKSEPLRAQSARINLVSAATDTSDAFAQSLQSAILKAKRA